MVITRGLEELTKGVVDERTRDILKTINEFYEPDGVQPITHLDEITVKAPFKKDLSELLGDVVGVRQIQQELVDSGFLSPGISEYSPDIREKIIDNIFENISTTHLPSYYLSPENPHLEDNRRIIATSQQMKNYLSKLGITHLDDVKSAHAFKKGLMRIYGVNVGNPKQMRRRLVELGTFSANIAEYSADIQKKIIDNIIDEISSTGFISSYLEPKNPHLEDNRRIIATSQHMKDYLLGLGIDHPDVVMATHAKKGLGTTLGFAEGSPHQMKQRFVEFDMFPQNQNLEQYSPELQVKFIDNIFENMGNDLSSFFLSDHNASRETNREVVIHSRQLYTYLDRHQIYSLHDIKSEHPGVKGLYKLFGLPEEDNDKLGQMLVDLELFGSTRERVSGKLSKPREDRDSGAILYFLNQYFASQQKTPLRHLDDVQKLHTTLVVGNFFDVKKRNPESLCIALDESDVLPLDLAAYSSEAQSSVINYIFDNESSDTNKSRYLRSTNPFLESNREILANSDRMRNVLETKGITHLDEIKYPPRGLGTIMGSRPGNSSEFKQRLVDLHLLSARIEDYSQEVQERILVGIINNISEPRPQYPSFYVSPNNEFIEDNRRFIGFSKTMKDYFDSIGVKSLDDIGENHPNFHMGAIYGAKFHNRTQLRRGLVKYGTFSARLTDYPVEVQDDVISHVVNNFSSINVSSFYISPDNPMAEENRRLIAVSRQMKEYLLDKGVNRLDDINRDHATYGVGGVFAFVRQSRNSMKRQLVDLGVFSAETGEYNITRPQKLVA